MRKLYPSEKKHRAEVGGRSVFVSIERKARITDIYIVPLAGNRGAFITKEKKYIAP